MALSNSGGTFSKKLSFKSFLQGSGSRYLQLDANGDGLTDIIALNYSSSGRSDYSWVALSNGDGSFSKKLSFNNFLQGSGSRYLQLDANGDGLTDIIALNHSSSGKSNYSWVALSNGDGSFSKKLSFKNFLQGSGSKYLQIDANDDGLLDVVAFNHSSSGTSDYSWVALSNGDGAFSKKLSFKSFLQGTASEYFQLDANSDGLTDIIALNHTTSGKTDYSWVALSNSSIPQLTTITDTQNNKTTLTYAPLTDKSVYTKGTGAQYPVVDLQYPQYVVSSVTTDNGIGGTLTTNYQYQGLKAHVKGRGSYGFAKIIESYPETEKTKELNFDQSAFPMVGNLSKVVEKYRNTRINQSDISYAHNKRSDGTYQVYQTKNVQSSYELDGQLVTKVTTTHADVDDYGNVQNIKVSTADNAGNQYQKETRNRFDNNTSRWHIGRLRDASVIHSAPSTANITRKSTFSYDANSGLLKTEQIISAQTNQALNTTTYGYDNFGQREKRHLSAAGETTRTNSTTYDSSGRVKTQCNALNFCITHEYNPQGLLKNSTDDNQINTAWLYDGFGRIKTATRADGTQTDIEYQFADSGLCGPLADGAYHCSITKSSGIGKTVIQYDSLDRELRKMSIGFDGREIYQDTQYNHLGQVARVSRPYFIGQNVEWATSEYDALGRMTLLTEPGPHGSTTTVKTQYQGLTTTTTGGPKQLVKTTLKNVVGKTVRIDEEENAFIQYSYYADGNLNTTKTSGVTDSLISLSYDEFGRKRGMNDPDMGDWQYTYTPFGQLHTQTDAKGQTTTFSYDQLGRKSTRTESEGVSTWLYYDSNAPQGSRGQLKSATSAGTQKTYHYDALGRPKNTTTMIDNSRYYSENHYDDLGRIKRVDYPGSSQFHVENIYNDYGYLARVQGARIKTQPFDTAKLLNLVQSSVALADDYTAKANQLRSIGQAYRAKIAYYQSITQSGTASISSDLQQQLGQHQAILAADIAKGEALDPKFIGHINHAIKELQNVQTLIDIQLSSYDDLISQLTLLAEQTLAAADHSFQYANTFERGVIAYNDNHAATDIVNYWRALNMDASGRITAEVYGSGVTNSYTYNESTGQLQSLHTGLLSFEPMRHLEYQYDAYNNVTYRDDFVNDIHEDFHYDRLDRLTTANVSSGLYHSAAFNSSQSLSYDALGNIDHKSDVGNYTYNGDGVHAVSRAGDNLYTYDANGNMKTGAGRSYVWSSYNKPTSITQAGREAKFYYGPDRARYKKLNHQGDTTHYLGLYEKTIYNDGKVEQKHYIYAAGKLVAEEIVSNHQGVQTRYLHQDALGSVDLITDANANVVDKRSFDAWGKMRDLPWEAQASLADPLYLTQLPFTNKAYTGHENIQEVGLIHMNGRVYDPVLGRFSSADVFIQSPWSSQSFNRYSYVWNNPMKFTDPTGWLIGGRGSTKFEADHEKESWNGGSGDDNSEVSRMAKKRATKRAAQITRQATKGANEVRNTIDSGTSFNSAVWIDKDGVYQHYYEYKTVLCHSSNCSQNSVFINVNKQSVPFTSDYHDGYHKLDGFLDKIGIENNSWSFDWLSSNPIEHISIDAEFTSLNVAQPGHVFDGVVEHKVTVSQSGMVTVRTVGNGTADYVYHGKANNAAGWYGFKEMHSNLRRVYQ